MKGNFYLLSWNCQCELSGAKIQVEERRWNERREEKRREEKRREEKRREEEKREEKRRSHMVDLFTGDPFFH